MNRLEHRIERDLRQIADRATPSPDAWNTILARIADQEPDTETEIIMLTEATTRTNRRWLLLASAAAAVVAIVGATVIAFAVNNTSSDDDHTPAPAATVAPTTAQPICPNPYNEGCRGLLSAGTYTTTNFEPAISYTVPDGWDNNLDTSRSFQLGPVNTDSSSPTYDRDSPWGDTRFISIYRGVAIPLACEERPDPSVGRTIEAMTEWLTSHPGLITTQPEPVEVGGLQGVVIDMSLDPTWTGGCPFSGGLPLVAFLTDSTPGGFDLTVDPGEQERLYLLQHTAGVIAIDVGAEKPFKLDPADWVGPPLQEVVAMATPILDELRFAA